MNIYIEFCIKWNYGPEFERVSNIIKSFNPNATITSNTSPPRSGAFEISIEQKLIFSKFQKNRFPDENEIKGWLQLWIYFMILKNKVPMLF